MPRMTIRATYALDKETDRCIRSLAKTWRVSQAEVVRRSVRTAAEQAREALTPADVVARYRQRSPVRNRAETRRLVDSLRQLRHADDARRRVRD